MMKKSVLLLLIVILIWPCQSQEIKNTNNFLTHFELSNGMETATYPEVIQFYSDLAESYSEISFEEIGETDSGHPLHIVTFNNDGYFDFSEIRKDKRILLINNGIHPGESDGIDATMILFRDLAKGKILSPERTVLVGIPIYNIGGSLNRNSGTRANQNGPKSYGFRGNARNFDLNRDFIKSDSKNAEAFAKIFHLVQPDVFIDNHVSNGADYQYTLTHLFTQHNKLGGSLGKFIHEEMQPELEKKLTEQGWDITPYVNVFNGTPENGFSQFMDHPRYSTGYTTLFNTLGMMVETHMLKPYKQRVEGTYQLMISMIEILEDRHAEIAELRKFAFDETLKSSEYALSWSIDTTRSTTLDFKGFEAEHITSEITGAMRLKYDRSKPFIREIKYQNYFIPTKKIRIPKAYIIPQGWHQVIKLLKLNNIEMKPLEQDSIIQVESYRIADFKTRTRVYEGHYPHYDTKLTSQIKEMNFSKGDLIVTTDQPSVRYLLETLEPEAIDSFFNWNFFDTILQQKEHFSPYVFEETAMELLESNSELKQKFDEKKASDDNFETNWYAQLNWIYKHSDHYEKAHMQYPVYRIN
jgi:hypothetical protein